MGYRPTTLDAENASSAASASSHTGNRIRSRRNASRTSRAVPAHSAAARRRRRRHRAHGGRVPDSARRWLSPSRPVRRRSAAGTAPPASAASTVSDVIPNVSRCAQHPVERAGVHLAPGVQAVDLARRARRPRRRARSPAAAVSAVIDVRVRWRSSARVPVSTVRPARMMLTRSHSASTSARMWLDSSTVRPSAGHLARRSPGTPPPSAGPARRWARRGRSSSTSDANAATSATFCRLPLE